MLPLWWRRQGSLNRPSSIEACCKYETRYPCNLGPFRCTKRTAIVRQQSVSARVAGLLLRCGPSCVMGGIWAIRIWKAVQAMLGRWSLAHVSKKLHKRCAPLFTYRNATTAVLRKVLKLRTQAASTHGFPVPIFGAVRHTMSSVFSASDFLALAATTGGATVTQQCAQNELARSTGAQTPPLRLFVAGVWSAFNDVQASKRLSSKINQRHDASLQAKGSWSGSRRVRPSRLRLARQPDRSIVPERMAA